MYKLIASDMDDTFISTEHSLVPANVQALKELVAQGVMFVPSSGRPYWSIMESLAEVADLLQDSYVISFNGGAINKVGCGTPVVSHCLKDSEVKSLCAYGKTLDCGIHIYELNGDVWAANLCQSEVERLDRLMAVKSFDQFFEASDYSFLGGRPVGKVLYVNEDVTWLEKKAHELSSIFSFADITVSANRYLEFNPKGVNKGEGLRELCELLNINLQDTIAVGDSLNDESMLLEAGVGVVVKNAHPAVIDSTNYQAKSSCNDGVLQEILDTFILSE